MNLLKIDLAEKRFEYPKGSLVITDEPILKRGVKVYDPAKHGLNPLPMEYREAREFAAAVFPDKDLMTYRNGRRALTRLVMDADRLDRLAYTRDDDDQEAKSVVEDILLSPLLRTALRKPIPPAGFTLALLSLLGSPQRDWRRRRKSSGQHSHFPTPAADRD